MTLTDVSTTTLRIATAGSVDDGKSTLIGRLLYDTKTVFEDQLTAVEKASRRYGDGETNLALLTDGLRAEREQGITIDVAHRYFATPHRSFIVADTPGHAQYTRNMVTGASTSDVAIVLVDARHGVLEQTRRHALIASLLGVQHIVLAVNKMDLVGWDSATFHRIVGDVERFMDALPDRAPVTALPISALLGDNVVEPSEHLPWFTGPTLLEFLERFETRSGAEVGARLHVQRVIRPHGGAHSDFRGYAGVAHGGNFQVGDPVTVLPSGQSSTIAQIQRWGTDVTVARPGHAIAIRLATEIDVARGDVIVSSAEQRPSVGDRVVVDLCWMVDRQLTLGSRWWFKHGTRSGHATVTAIEYRLDPHHLKQTPADALALNDLARIHLQLSETIVADHYHLSPESGRLILIDPVDNSTSAAAMIRHLEPST